MSCLLYRLSTRLGQQPSVPHSNLRFEEIGELPIQVAIGSEARSPFCMFWRRVRQLGSAIESGTELKDTLDTVLQVTTVEKA